MLTDGKQRLVVVSNRLPSIDPPASEEEERAMPVGGLVTAVRAALEERGGMWFGWSGRLVTGTAPSVPSVTKVGRFELASVDLNRRDSNLFYNDFCNRALWPLLHSFPARVVVRHEAYRAYRRVNRAYAEALRPLLREGDLVWVQDFHVMPLAYELRRLGWRGKIGFFLHTPFPPPEVFSVLPWAPRILETLLDYDLMELHIRRYVYNLFECLSAELPGGATIGETFNLGNRSLEVKSNPIGTDPEMLAVLAARSEESATGKMLRRLPSPRRIVLGVDRLDYTKGIVNRLLTIEHFLARYPSMRGKVYFIEVSAPSRTRVPEYVEEKRQVEELVGRINGRFSEADWVPLRYHYRSFPWPELVAFYRQADVCVLTPLRDGMNLVAKEFVASQGDDPGVVVLSRFAGVADSMDQAVLVNPYDIEGTAESIHRALLMPPRERRARWEALNRDVRFFTARRWSDSFVAELAGA